LYAAVIEEWMETEVRIIALAWLLVFSLAHYQEIWRTCIGVIDGDTIVLDGEEKVRFSNQ